MYLTGIADEAGASMDAQIQATRELGWRYIEARVVEAPGFPKGNIHDIPDAAFEIVQSKLEAAGIGVCCFGSGIMNWAKRVEDPFEVTLAEVRRAIPRMKKLGTNLVRIMSFKPGDDDNKIPPLVFDRVREVTKMFRDAGIQPVHENCMNYGGMGWPFTLQLLERVPGLKLVFDTANPLLNADRAKPRPWPQQDPWEFYSRVKEHIVHVHVKDGVWVPAKKDAAYKFPGEGDAQVRKILKDLFANGYDGGISIEPHMAVVFHDKNVKASPEAQHDNYVEYGRRMAKLIEEVQKEMKSTQQHA